MTRKAHGRGCCTCLTLCYCQQCALQSAETPGGTFAASWPFKVIWARTRRRVAVTAGCGFWLQLISPQEIGQFGISHGPELQLAPHSRLVSLGQNCTWSEPWAGVLLLRVLPVCCLKGFGLASLSAESMLLSYLRPVQVLCLSVVCEWRLALQSTAGRAGTLPCQMLCASSASLCAGFDGCVSGLVLQMRCLGKGGRIAACIWSSCAVDRECVLSEVAL
jgi:hypothetical protein